MSFYAEYKANMPKKLLISWPLVNMRPTCNNEILGYWFTRFRENEKNISFPKHPEITQKFTQNRQIVVNEISRILLLLFIQEQIKTFLGMIALYSA